MNYPYVQSVTPAKKVGYKNRKKQLLIDQKLLKWKILNAKKTAEVTVKIVLKIFNFFF